MSIIRYQDTRGLDPGRPLFTDVVVKGIARGGGLYVPEALPSLERDEIEALTRSPYRDRAAVMFERFGVDVDAARLRELMKDAYGENFDDDRIAPTVEVSSGMHVLELWHGPTAAFKDMALQCMPLFFSEAVAIHRARGERQTDYLILIATSGDTGKAALEGFADREHTAIVVFYPAAGVSDMQRRQMITQRGENVAVFGVDGNFDDCQNAVKAAFNDAVFNQVLFERHGVELSSANSINWGRLLPQVVYYASAYADMVGCGAISRGGTIDVCVPTGNFGNILGAYYAKRIGVPIGRLLCASNENNVLTDFIETGIYDIADRPFVTTPSPSMDILVSSNLERLLFELCQDGDRVRRWIDDLARDKRFEIDADMHDAIRVEFVGDFVTNDESLQTIERVYRDHGYLMDPHTAVAWRVAERHAGAAPVLIVSTAHWAKFGRDVYRALNGVPYDSPLPDRDAKKPDTEIMLDVCEIAPGQTIPPSLAGLDELEDRFTTVIDRTREAVETQLVEWLDAIRR